MPPPETQHPASSTWSSRARCSSSKPHGTVTRRPERVTTSNGVVPGGVTISTARAKVSAAIRVPGPGARRRRRCHQRSVQTGTPERRDNSAQLQPPRSRRDNHDLIRSGSWCCLMTATIPQGARQGKTGITRRLRSDGGRRESPEHAAVAWSPSERPVAPCFQTTLATESEKVAHRTSRPVGQVGPTPVRGGGRPDGAGS